jgi:hypothetical protein
MMLRKRPIAKISREKLASASKYYPFRGGDFEFLLKKSPACFAVSGQPYLCKWKNRPRFTPPRLQGKEN